MDAIPEKQVQVGPHGERRSELSEFLRSRRARLGPAELGLIPGPRRRLEGLRREEVAQISGVGLTWYTWLEQGRPIRVSVEVLDAVARTLRLDPVERRHLHLLAGANEQLPADTALEPAAEVLAVLESLEPIPAVLISDRWDCLAANPAYDALFAFWHSRPCRLQNMLWCVLTEPTARAKYLNYDEEAPWLVARLRTALAGHLHDPNWTGFVEALSEASPDFDELWSRHELAHAETRRKVFLHPEAGRLAFLVTPLVVAVQPGTEILVYAPDDEHTRSHLPPARETPD